MERAAGPEASDSDLAVLGPALLCELALALALRGSSESPASAVAGASPASEGAP